MKSLPSHTTRYFAQEVYRAWIYNGIARPQMFRTVQGVEIKVTVSRAPFPSGCLIEWENGSKFEPARKSWVY